MEKEDFLAWRVKLDRKLDAIAKYGNMLKNSFDISETRITITSNRRLFKRTTKALPINPLAPVTITASTLDRSLAILREEDITAIIEDL